MAPSAVTLVLFAVVLGVVHAQGTMPSPFYRVLSVQNPPMQGDDVVILQNLIIRSPYVTSLNQTGKYDQQTANAVTLFQQGNKLHVNEYGVFDAPTANLLLSLHSCDGYVDDGTPAGKLGYLYKIYVQIFNNRSVETNAMLFDANNTLRHKFRVRLHGYDTTAAPPTWPSYSNTIGLNQFSSNGATPTGLMECDLDSPEGNATLYGPFPINRLLHGKQGNGQFLMTNTNSIRNGILLHTGIWPGWNPTMDMPNSEGCIHAHPEDIAKVWVILTEELGVQVRSNPGGKQPYPYTPQGLFSIEQVGCQ